MTDNYLRYHLLVRLICLKILNLDKKIYLICSCYLKQIPLFILFTLSPLYLYFFILLKLINYSCAGDPISLHQLSQVCVF